jgi:hypothetical protein
MSIIKIIETNPSSFDLPIPIELTRLESVGIDDQQSALGIVPLTRPGVPSGVIGIDGELTGGSQVGGRGEAGGFVQDRLWVEVEVDFDIMVGGGSNHKVLQGESVSERARSRKTPIYSPKQ